MNATYTEAFVEQALAKVFSRGSRTIRSVAQELNVNFHTIKGWMKSKKVDKAGVAPLKERRPQDWSAQQRLVALHETHGMAGEALNTWCRERGVFAHDLAAWRAAFCVAGNAAAPGAGEVRQLKEANEKLRRELARKERALAEAAALLVLQKKFRALWEDEVK
jgi:transposase-like protein